MQNPYSNPWGQDNSFSSWFGLLNPTSSINYNANPTDLYGAFSSLVGGGGTNGFYKWLSNQQGRYQGQYNAQAATDPTAQWSDFLGNLNTGRDYSTFATPWDRGDTPQFKAPTGRMVW